MLECLNFLRGEHLTLLSIFVRCFLAVLCGGFIGIDRERKRRPAGFRTHILICLGAAMTTLTSQYISLELDMFTDMARLGAQVIAGIGFIGAGTIIITKRRNVKGLTTAAGLWASAIVGLCCGAGYFEGAVVATIVIFIAEFAFAKIEYRIVAKSRKSNIYVEYSDPIVFAKVIDFIKEKDVYIVDLEITKKVSATAKNQCAILSVQTPRKLTNRYLIEMIAQIEGVIAVEEL